MAHEVLPTPFFPLLPPFSTPANCEKTPWSKGRVEECIKSQQSSSWTNSFPCSLVALILLKHHALQDSGDLCPVCSGCGFSQFGHRYVYLGILRRRDLKFMSVCLCGDGYGRGWFVMKILRRNWIILSRSFEPKMAADRLGDYDFGFEFELTTYS